MNKEDLIKKFDRQASIYENNRNNLVLWNWRAKLLQDATGSLLELAVGVGANFPFYDRHRVRVTAVDFSPTMIKKAEEFADRLNIRFEFLLADIEQASFQENQFDTVVSTLSLCGLLNPVAVLNHFNRWCRDGGHILLMEHGISSNWLLAAAQKVLDPIAYRVSGCHYDRDMMKLVEKSDLLIEKSEHHWFDTVHLIWARPDKTA
ncbi:MAG: class I SAM-dependent methyltransferase [Actinobacteria bacterium]|nr:class I SAM-dependent methyltransferase [Actinomycetota bacterium]